MASGPVRGILDPNRFSAEDMATPEQPAYRKAVFEARAHAREDAAVRARERRLKLSMLAGVGLSFVLLGTCFDLDCRVR